MKFSVALALPLLAAAAVYPRQSSLDTFVTSELSRSLKGVLDNIGASGAKAQGAARGIIIASPSKVNPDYFYTWTRDASLVAKALTENLISTGNTSLEKTLDDFVASQAAIQQVNNPSGGFTTGGLGEPKYLVDGSAFTGAWGRPQRDGPSLRAISIIGYGEYLIGKGRTAIVRQNLVPLIQADLNYVVQNWNNTGFDLWEEVSGSSFFTLSSQYRAMVQGSTFFAALGSPNSQYAATAARILCFLQDFWSPAGYIVSNINTGNGRTGKDANSILTAVHGYDASDRTCSSVTFQPCSDRALSNHKAVVDSFRTIYAINSGIPSNQAASVGRYSEDSYFGGNPWYLATLAASEQLYLALSTWNAVGTLNITETSLPFFTAIRPFSRLGSFTRGTNEYIALTSAVRAYADGFVALVQKYVGPNGGLAEQYTRGNGQPLSAVDLTWSYAAFITATAARQGQTPPAWASNSISTSCGGGGGGGGGGGNVAMTFNVIANTRFGQNIFLVGSIPALGNWNPSSAIPLSADQYTSSNNLWRTASPVNIPASTSFQYKFIRRAENGAITWEQDPNRTFTTPGNGAVTLNDRFR